MIQYKFTGGSLSQGEKDMVTQLLKRWLKENDERAAVQLVSFTQRFVTSEDWDEAMKKLVTYMEVFKEIDHREEKGAALDLDNRGKGVVARIKFQRDLLKALNVAYEVLQRLGFAENSELDLSDLEEEDDVEVIEDSLGGGRSSEDAEKVSETEK